MKKITGVVTTLLLLLFSCTDISDLENRLSDLEKRVDVIEKLSLSDAVLSIEEMQGKVDVYDATIDSLQDKILDINDQLQNPGSNGETDVYWGDVISDDQFDDFAKGDYTKITGKVLVTSDEQVGLLQGVTFIGSDLVLSYISGDKSFEMLEVISGSLLFENIISDDSLNLSFPKLVGITQDVANVTGTARHLRSLDFPELVVVGGNVSLSFPARDLDNMNFFSSLTVPSLSIVGDDFEIVNSELLEDLQLALVLVGGNFNLDNNQILFLGRSDINSIERIEGGLYLVDNLARQNGQVAVDYLAEVNLLPNLSYVGTEIKYLGSEDLYSFNGFGSLLEVPGSLYFFSSIMGYGRNENVKFFNKLQTVGGDFLVGASTPTTRHKDDEDAPLTLEGFESLVSIGGDFQVAIDETYGFDQLSETGSVRNDSTIFSISGSEMPQFASLKCVHGKLSMVSLRIGKIKSDNLFPVFGQDVDSIDMKRVRLAISLEDRSTKQTINRGFSKITNLGSLQISSASHIDDEYFTITEGAFASLAYVGSPNDTTNYFDIEVGSSTDLSCFANYFISKANDYKTANDNYQIGLEDYDDLFDLYISDSLQYVSDYNEYLADTANIEQPVPSFQRPKDPVLTYTQTSYIKIHSQEVQNIENPTEYFYESDNYAEIKEDPESDIPALIQCFMKYGKLTAADLNY